MPRWRAAHSAWASRAKPRPRPCQSGVTASEQSDRTVGFQPDRARQILPGAATQKVGQRRVGEIGDRQAGGGQQRADGGGIRAGVNRRESSGHRFSAGAGLAAEEVIGQGAQQVG